MPLKVGHGGDVDKDILASLGKEALLPHLNLDGVGGMLDNLDDHNVVEAADETHKALNDVDDKTTKHVLPGLWEGERERERDRERENERENIMAKVQKDSTQNFFISDQMQFYDITAKRTQGGAARNVAGGQRLNIVSSAKVTVKFPLIGSRVRV